MELPTNPLVGPLLTDMYQISMTYAYWKNNKADDYAVFDLFFRKNPFHGEYCIFAGLEEVVKFVANFKFTTSDIDYLKKVLAPTCDPEFFVWLLSMDCSKVKLYAIPEGSIVFPKEPLLRVEGPLAITQLIETTLLNLVNFPSLIATNAARMRLAAGDDKTLLEFGLRRAQGPDGGLTASKYAYLGGFDGTSHVLAGKLFNINVKGTHAHSFVMSYTGLKDLQTTKIQSSSDPNAEVEFLSLVLEKRKILNFEDTNEGELAAFVAYAQSFPSGVVALVDTYDTLTSGVPNFLAVGWALKELGYTPVGIRLDSGDLAYLSKKVREMYQKTDAQIGQQIFSKCGIVASNDINEEILLSLNREGHEINTFGIGTHLVTCQRQPALGCVYKLVEINGHPRIKLSQDMEKLIIPGKKSIYRLYGVDGHSLVDLMQLANEPAPEPGQKILIRDPFTENKRAHVTPLSVKSLLNLVFDGSLPLGSIKLDSLEVAKQRCKDDIKMMRNDHVRQLNPTPYKVSVTKFLYDYMHELWMNEAPIADLS